MEEQLGLRCGEAGRLYEGAEAEQPRYSWPLPALIHWVIIISFGGCALHDHALSYDQDVRQARYWLVASLPQIG